MLGQWETLLYEMAHVGINMLMCLTTDGMVFVGVPLWERKIQRMLVLATSKSNKIDRHKNMCSHLKLAQHGGMILQARLCVWDAPSIHTKSTKWVCGLSKWRVDAALQFSTAPDLCCYLSERQPHTGALPSVFHPFQHPAPWAPMSWEKGGKEELAA